MSSVHFSSQSDEWSTPLDFFVRVVREFGSFDLDPCALPSSAKSHVFYTPEDDGLSQEWFGSVWMNPPYGRKIGDWTQRAHEHATSSDSARVVALLPARTDTHWWHRDVMNANEIRLIKGRLRFGGAINSAPFPSVLVVWSGLDTPPTLTTMDSRIAA